MAALRALSSVSELLKPPRSSPLRPMNCENGRALLPRSLKPLTCSNRKSSSLVQVDLHSERRSCELEFGGEVEEIAKGMDGMAIVGVLENVLSENSRALAIGSLVFALVCLPDEHALALGPGGPLFEEFWDNVRRYGFYFFTVVSGGLYSLTRPVLDLLKDPSTQLLVLVAVIGTFYLMYLTVSTMLGLNDFDYQYAQ